MNGHTHNAKPKTKTANKKKMKINNLALDTHQPSHRSRWGWIFPFKMQLGRREN